MKHHSLLQNLLSLLLGCIIGVPLGLYADAHRTVTNQEYPVQIYEFHFEEIPEHKKIEYPVLPEPTPDDIEEEMYWDSLELLACCVEAESGNQSEEGKRLVTDEIGRAHV